MNCKFLDKLSDYLRDRLVSELRDDAVKKRLLGESELTYETAVKSVQVNKVHNCAILHIIYIRLQ